LYCIDKVNLIRDNTGKVIFPPIHRSYICCTATRRSINNSAHLYAHMAAARTNNNINKKDISPHIKRLFVRLILQMEAQNQIIRYVQGRVDN